MIQNYIYIVKIFSVSIFSFIKCPLCYGSPSSFVIVQFIFIIYKGENPFETLNFTHNEYSVSYIYHKDH